MAKASLNDSLQQLCEVDSKLVAAETERDQLVSRKRLLEDEIAERRQRLTELEEAVQAGTAQQVLQEHSLRDEQDKIVQRRKQLTSIGGAKAGKLLEREVDTASKTLQAMEERAIKALEEVDALESQLTDMRDDLKELEDAFEEETKDFDSNISGYEKEISSSTSEREKVLSKIDKRFVSAYERINGRYPGDAVAVVKAGACTSCFRFLPAQTNIEVLLEDGRLMECPGCCRILVNGENEQ